MDMERKSHASGCWRDTYIQVPALRGLHWSAEALRLIVGRPGLWFSAFALFFVCAWTAGKAFCRAHLLPPLFFSAAVLPIWNGVAAAMAHAQMNGDAISWGILRDRLCQRLGSLLLISLLFPLALALFILFFPLSFVAAPPKIICLAQILIVCSGADAGPALVRGIEGFINNLAAMLTGALAPAPALAVVYIVGNLWLVAVNPSEPHTIFRDWLPWLEPLWFSLAALFLFFLPLPTYCAVRDIFYKEISRGKTTD